MTGVQTCALPIYVGREYIEVDLTKLKRIFSNVIENSIRYLSDGGNIVIRIEKHSDIFQFVIADNGIGVEEEILDKIFEPLFTTDPSRKISGLGLSIVKEFVVLHHGQIEAYNHHGLTISFSIPQRQDDV